MKAYGRFIGSLLLAVAAWPASAAEDVSEALRACRTEADDARRLACYDRVSGHAQPQPSTAAAAPKSSAPPPAAAPKSAPASAAPSPVAPAAAATVATPAAATAEEKFGRERAMAAEEEKRKSDESRELGELSALVTGIDTRIDGLMTITLDNGQVWRQNTPDSKFRLKTGDHVRIQPGSLKSFIMSGPSKHSTRVTRVK
jgi:hypothetical protein